jgi:hypothetical protein
MREQEAASAGVWQPGQRRPAEGRDDERENATRSDNLDEIRYNV